MSATALSEPEVLASAKARLFPDPDEERTYAVCDTQFGQVRWLPGERVPDSIRERLAPFSRVRVGSGYHSPTVFQLKAMLYHVGPLTERGSESSTDKR